MKVIILHTIKYNTQQYSKYKILQYQYNSLIENQTYNITVQDYNSSKNYYPIYNPEKLKIKESCWLMLYFFDERIIEVQLYDYKLHGISGIYIFMYFFFISVRLGNKTLWPTKFYLSIH